MAADSKEVLRQTVHGQEPLHVGGGLEAAHLALALPGRLVRDFSAMVRVLVCAIDHGRHHGAAGRRVAAQLVGDQSSRDTALSFQQLPEEAEGRQPIAARLHENVDRVAVFVDGPPQILLPPPDLDAQLVQMPGVALAAPAVSQPPCVVEPERSTPVPNRFIGHGDTPFGVAVRQGGAARMSWCLARQAVQASGQLGSRPLTRVEPAIAQTL